MQKLFGDICSEIIKTFGLTYRISMNSWELFNKEQKQTEEQQLNNRQLHVDALCGMKMDSN